MVSSTTPTPLHRWLWQRWRSRLWSAGIIFVWFVELIHWTIRDWIPGLSALFYATPPIVVSVLALGFTLIVADRARIRINKSAKWANRATLLLGALLLVQWVIQDFRSGPSPQPSPDAIKVVFWNIGSGNFASADRIGEQAQKFDADVLAFAEAYASFQSPTFWKQHLPEHSAIPLTGGMIVLVKGSARNVKDGKLAASGNYRRLSLDVRGHQFDVLMGDLASDPLRSRQPPLQELFRLMQSQTQVPTIVVGDFNTPPTSIWFDDWRATWSRAWDAAGSGYQPTWPQPFPVLALDHLWGNVGVTFSSCRHGWSSCSDHRPVIAEFTVTAKPSE